MDCERTRALPCPDPVADELSFEQQRASGTTFVFRPLGFGGEWAVRNAHGREVQHSAEVEGQAGSARVVAAGGVDQEHVRRLRQCAYRGFEQGALAQRE